MYHGEVLIMKDQLQSFLQTAEVLQVSGLIGCTNFPIKNVINPPKNIKTPKVVKPPDYGDSPAKKPKIVNKQKLKVNSSPSTSSSGSENLSLSPRDTLLKQSPSHEKFELVSVDKIKTEVEDDRSEEGDRERPYEQSPLLEAALEVKESHPSILERSLKLHSTPSKLVCT